MTALLFELGAAEGVAAGMIRHLNCERGSLESRHFPDGESYVRFRSDVRGREVILLCSLNRPDEKLLPLLFVADAARAQGARSVGLAAPYLAYLRQDKAFHSGEAVTSVTFARLLSGHFDWLATVDPHLHRYHSLAQVYSIPTVTVSAADRIGAWIADAIERPVIVGPDEESRQWVERVGRAASAPAVTLAKTRSGDRSVSIDDRGLEHLAKGNAVIVDDIASSAQTMIEAVGLLRKHGHERVTCVVVHPIFAGDSYQRLRDAGPAQIVSTNSITHQSNAIDISLELGEAVRSLI